MKISSSKRVVITGLGIVSSIGIGWKEFWKNLLAGRSGISKVGMFDTSDYERHFAGEVKDFDPTQYINKRKVERIGRASQLAIATSKLALRDASINFDVLKSSSVGVSIGSTMGEQAIMEKFNDSRLSNDTRYFKENLISVFPANSISTNVALYFKIRGPNTVFTTACSSGNYALGRAYDLIQKGDAELALAGGADAFSRVVFTGFGRLFAIAPEKCQPFDQNRKGMLPGEGSAMLVLEPLERALKRKARIYAEVAGYGLSCDAHHMTQPSGDGIAKAITKALRSCGCRPSEIDYVSAHGTGTRENDKAESQALYKVFGEGAKQIPVSSIKSMLGHTMGAASAMESVACCLSIDQEEIPPTINFENKDPECDVDCVPNFSRKKRLKTVLNNASAFGGNNACVVLKKVD
jgi:3-oxoacyl-[acyl-carrier-protein] synthase II